MSSIVPTATRGGAGPEPRTETTLGSARHERSRVVCAWESSRVWRRLFDLVYTSLK